MRLILKITSLVMLWGVLVGMIIFVEPISIRDIGIEGSYLPFLGLVMVVVFYTWLVAIKSWKKAIILTVLTELLLLASIYRFITWFLGGVILVAIIAVLFVKKEKK